MKIVVFLIVICACHGVMAQNVSCEDHCSSLSHPFKYTQLIAPVVLIGVGVVGLESDWIKSLNLGIRDEIKEHIDKRITIDDISQYAPMVAVYGFNLCGVKGKHSFRDRSVILATSYLIMGTVVYGMKKWTKEERPDGSAFNSFPSGHTATAFMGAEFLRQEYKEQSVWYGVAGYVVATGTGLFRM
ncbi:MAG: PAP2 family protein, partial [Odoribacter sp.]